ncbi:hypothetical protein EMPS_04656 [Entomortierella parvispora]|uniref:F-box domain-containing protein n=1 Tax=Entomortierella parvispora TaxID=205924 RepID=A0A9P3H8V4_9FUNG|nr:hypothetical protein EMPS_04656 [Entomortierella parvispora]
MEEPALLLGAASGLTTSATGSQGQETPSLSPALPSGGIPGALALTTVPQGYKNPSPLEISELLTRIVSLVDQTTLLACQVVCKEWRRTLEFLIWRDLKLVQLGNRFKQPMTDNCIRQHAPLVQRLSICVDPRYYQPSSGNLDNNLCLRTTDFPKLTSLEIGIQLGLLYWSSQTEEMVYLTYKLFRLMLDSSSLLSGGGQGFPMLQVLKIADLQFKFLPREWMTLWETLWSRLQVLSLTGHWWGYYQVFPEEENMDDIDDDRPWQRYEELCNKDEMQKLARRHGPSWTMRDLTLISYSRDMNRGVYEIQSWMVGQCPDLVRLKWSVDWYLEAEQRPMELIRDLVMEGSQLNPPQFQELETLDLPRQFYGEEFVDLIDAMPRLTMLKMEDVKEFEENPWILLKATAPRHLNTLRILDVRCSGVGSHTLIDMLCSLPNLEVFQGDTITDLHLREDPRPWACRGALRRLELDFKITTQRRVLSQSLIVSRLAEMEQLEDLRVSCSPLRLDLSKPKGMLERLKTLKHLKTLSLESRNENFNCDWGQVELAWVRENWPKLKYVDWIEYKDEVKEEDKFPRTPPVEEQKSERYYTSRNK